MARYKFGKTLEGKQVVAALQRLNDAGRIVRNDLNKGKTPDDIGYVSAQYNEKVRYGSAFSTSSFFKRTFDSARLTNLR